MDTFSDPAVTEPEVPLTEAGQAALRDELLAQYATLPTHPDAPYSRGLWLDFICQWGFQSRAVFPVDNRLDRGDPDNIASLADLLAFFMSHPMGGDQALVVLTRPGPADITDGDEYICRALSEAATRYETVPWAFYVVTTGWVQEVRPATPIIRTLPLTRRRGRPGPG
jgi:hypothetical protein